MLIDEASESRAAGAQLSEPTECRVEEEAANRGGMALSPFSNQLLRRCAEQSPRTRQDQEMQPDSPPRGESTQEDQRHLSGSGPREAPGSAKGRSRSREPYPVDTGLPFPQTPDASLGAGDIAVTQGPEGRVIWLPRNSKAPLEATSCSESRTMLENTLSAGRGTSPSDRACVGVDPRVMHFEPDPWTRGRDRLETPLSQGPFS